MLHQKHESYKYVNMYWHGKIEFIEISTRQEKNATTAKMYIFIRSVQKLKNIFFPL